MKYGREPLLLRAAGGPTTGVGHLVRTRSLAQECERRGLGFEFVVDDEASAEWLRARGTRATVAGSTLDWLRTGRAVWLDGFRDWKAELALANERELTSILVENRIADRGQAGFVVYPALHWEADEWDAAHAERVFGGGDWIPLSSEVLNVESPPCDIDLLVSFGGSDPGYLSERTLCALDAIGYAGRVVCVVGPRMLERRAGLERAGSGLRSLAVVDGSLGIAELEARACTAITALGTTLYELAWFGVPALILANYESDRPALDWYRRRGIHTPIGVSSELDEAQLASALKGGLADLETHPVVRGLYLAGGSRRIVDLLSAETVHA